MTTEAEIGGMQPQPRNTGARRGSGGSPLPAGGAPVPVPAPVGPGLSRRREPKKWGARGVLEFGAGTKEQAAPLLPTGLPLSGSGCWRRAEPS